MQLHLGIRMINALIVVVYRNGQRDLRAVLPDDILIEHGLELLRGRQALGLDHRGFFAFVRGKIQLIVQNAGAYADALVANIHARTGDQLAHPILRLAAEGAFQRFFIIIIRHMAPLSG